MTNVQDTSRKSYAANVVPSLGARQVAVLIELGKADSLTNSQLAGRLEWPINTVTPRVFELRRLGLVQEATRRPCPVTGRMAIAWTIIKETDH